MPTTIITTKLYIPKPRPDLVPRPRLINQLNTGISRNMTLISAPAGFGKSTLLSAWVEQIKTGTQVAWLSLDDGDNDLNRFLTYFVVALQSALNDFGQGVLVALQSPGTINNEAVLTALINEIAESSEEIVLVLDDYHVIESQPVDETIAFILDHMPPQLHLVIASRIDPSLPLSRLRARGLMTELRVNDLRFTLDEAVVFLNRVIEFNLSDQDFAALEERTEGWIAGLQLAAFSMQALEDGREVAGFVNRFTGSDRYIQDYLVDEVLQQQPVDLRDFLLQTSILDRMSAPLCDAVLDEINSQTILEGLETSNLFIVPLDNQRYWYRYHHLFADLLMHRLRQTTPDRIVELHQRASYWYQCNDYPDDAIRHAQVAGDDIRLADIIEEYWYLYVHRGEMNKLIQLLDSLGPKYTKVSAPLSMAYAWIHYLQANIDPIPGYLQDIQNLIDGGSITEDTWSQMEFAVIPSLMETLEASQSLAKANLEDAKMHATSAISLIPDDPDPKFPRLLRAAALHKLAQVHLEMDEFDQACAILFDVLEMLKASEDYLGMGNILFQIVSVYRELEKTKDAISLCEDTLRFVVRHHWEKIPPSGMVNLILADLQADMGDFEAARGNLEIGSQLTAPVQAPQILILVKRVEEKLDNFTPVSQPFVEPLSRRELEVLQLVAQGLSNREIGERLYLALDTVKGHNRRIYAKMGVKNRAQAINKAISLQIIHQQ